MESSIILRRAGEVFNQTLVNVSKSSQPTKESLEFIYIKVTFYFVILFCATFGNSMVVYVICTSKRLRSTSHLLILNLALCDLFTPLVSIPFDFALEENDYVWFYGDFMCKFLYPAATFSTTASSLTLAAISLDRYRLLMHPFKRKLSSRQIKFIILGIYVLSALIISPYTYALRVIDESCMEQGWSTFFRKLYTMTLFLFQYALPLVFMSIMYTLAIINLKSTSGKVKDRSIHGRHYIDKKDCDNLCAKRILFNMNPFKNCVRSTSNENPNIRATKMFMAVVLVFAIFMFPNQIIWLYKEFTPNARDNAQVNIICWLFTYTNSVVNPIIFAIFSKDFRVGFIGVFRLIFCCSRDALPERCWRAHMKNDCSVKSRQTVYEVLNILPLESNKPRLSGRHLGEGFVKEKQQEDYIDKIQELGVTHGKQNNPIIERMPTWTTKETSQEQLTCPLDVNNNTIRFCKELMLLENNFKLPINYLDILETLHETYC